MSTEVEATRPGMVPCYLSRVQLTALLQECKETGLTRGLLMKYAIVAMLVRRGRLPQSELDIVEQKMADATFWPHPGRKEPENLSQGRAVEKPEDRRQRRRRRLGY